MPKLPPKPCTHPACRSYAEVGARCSAHQYEKWSHMEKGASARGYGYAWTKLRKAALTRDGHLCQPCLRVGVYTKAVEVDHIVPKCDGGGDSSGNLQSICSKCHKEKTLSESRRSTCG